MADSQKRMNEVLSNALDPEKRKNDLIVPELDLLIESNYRLDAEFGRAFVSHFADVIDSQNIRCVLDKPDS